MSKKLYFECNSGISGDMTVAALLDLMEPEQIKEFENTINILKENVAGFNTEIKRVVKAGVAACDFNVILDAQHENHDHDMEYLHGHDSDHSHEHHHHEHEHEHHHHEHEHEHHHHEHEHEHHHHEHEHEHHHEHRNLRDINNIIELAQINASTKESAKKIFHILAESEAKAHNKPIDEVHFHEVGAVDSIVDIIAVAECMRLVAQKYDIEDVIVPVLNEGTGTVRCQHGILSVPVPATANILQKYSIPVHIMTDVQGEFVTPTGAAIVASLKTSDKLPDKFNLIKTGIGAGKREYKRPSLLRIMLIESKEEDTEQIYKLECNVDDCSGEALGYTMERLFEAGARDVSFMPIYMKKNRPAYQLNVICEQGKISELENIIFMETTTIGIRRMKVERTVLDRTVKKFETTIGSVDIKICKNSDESLNRVYPEYDSLIKICREKNIAYIDAYNTVMSEIN